MKSVARRISRLQDRFLPAVREQIVVSLYDAGHELPKIPAKGPYRSEEQHFHDFFMRNDLDFRSALSPRRRTWTGP
jgi:hypothetical protein